jgi:hypothetical protein
MTLDPDSAPVPDSRVRAARDLTNISLLAELLHAAAISSSNARVDGTALAGGRAMVAMTHVGSPEAWAEQVEADELYHLTVCAKSDHAKCQYAQMADYEDEDDEPPLQTLRFWSERWRTAKDGYRLDRAATLRGEIAYLRDVLAWAHEHEEFWGAFVTDLAKVRTRLEDTVAAGTRVAFRGVPCMYDECGGARLVRKTVPTRDFDTGEKTYRLTDWHCPRCKRQWTEDEYARNVYAATESLHYANLGAEAWCSLEKAAKRVDRPRLTVWSWTDRLQVASVCRVTDRRVFVRVADVHDRNQLAVERAQQREAAMKAKNRQAV